MTRWLERLDLPGETARLGPLEWRVLEAMWSRGTSATVPDLHRAFPDSAYSTIMTTMDRLFQKGLLDRVRRGRGYAYQAKVSRHEMEFARASGALRAALQAADRTELTPLLSLLVETVSAHPQLLDELEKAIVARRSELENSPS